MTKLVETLKAAGWVETTLGECQVGEEVVCWPRLVTTPQALRVTRPAEWREGEGVYVSTNDGRARRDTTPVLRSPRPERPECAPGTVAMIRWRGGKSIVRALKVSGQWVPPSGIPLDDEGVEVVRVLLPADQDTPTVEVTDEMFERAVLAMIDGGHWPTNEELGGSLTGTRDDKFRDSCREEARRILDAALGGDES